MVLEIYLDLFSQPCRSVYIFAKKNNIQFDHKKIVLFDGYQMNKTYTDPNCPSGEQFSEEFGRINLLRKVPAIRDGDFCLAESVAILMYLAEKFHSPDHWYPADLQKRALVNEYLSWQHAAIRLHAAKIIWLKLLIPKAMEVEVPKDKMDYAIENLNGTLKQFEEKFLQDRPFIVGDQISLADLVAVVEIIQPLGAGLDVFENRPKLRAWKDRVREAVGAELFDEAHQNILSCQEIVETMDRNKFEAFKPQIVKYFLS